MPKGNSRQIPGLSLAFSPQKENITEFSGKWGFFKLKSYTILIMQPWQILWTVMPPFTPCQKKPLSFHMKISVSFKHLFEWANALPQTETLALARTTYEDIYSTWACICFSLTPIIIQAYFKTCLCLLSSVVITCQNKKRHMLNINSMFLLFFFHFLPPK